MGTILTVFKQYTHDDIMQMSFNLYRQIARQAHKLKAERQLHGLRLAAAEAYFSEPPVVQGRVLQLGEFWERCGLGDKQREITPEDEAKTIRKAVEIFERLRGDDFIE